MSVSPKVVVVHDYATQRGGGERVALELLRSFPGARMVTGCWDKAGTYPDFGDFEVETLWTNRVSALRHDPRRAFFFLARAFAEHTISDADVVVCSSSGWSHRVATDAPKIVYCHNPARWLYQPQDYLAGVSPWLRNRFVRSTDGLRQSDDVAAHTAAQYVVNSTAVAARVRSAYGISASVVPPARGISPDGPRQPIEGIEPGFLLTVSRPRAYKHADVVCDAVATLPGERLVVVGGLNNESWPIGVTAVNGLSDAELRWLYANASALVAVSHEDFGLTPVEAQAFGVPSVVLRAGGYLDSSVEGVTSVFVDEATPGQVAAGIRELFSRSWDAAAIRRCGERFSSQMFTERMHGVVDNVLAGTTVAPVPLELARAGRLGRPPLHLVGAVPEALTA